MYCDCYYLGDVKNVIEGRVPPELRGVSLDASRFHCGFEAADIDASLAGAGEMVLVGHRAYVRSTDRSRPDRYLRTVDSERLFTTGAIFVPEGTKPASVYRLDTRASDVGGTQTFMQLVQEVHRQSGSVPLVVSGFVHFRHLRATYITSPPVNGLNIFENKQRFYEDGNVESDDVWAAAVGCMHDFGLPQGAAPAGVAEELGRVLYDNPNERRSGVSTLNVHTHIATLPGGRTAAEGATSVAALQRSDVGDVWHLLSDSTVDYAVLEVFPIRSLTPVPL